MPNKYPPNFNPKVYKQVINYEKYYTYEGGALHTTRKSAEDAYARWVKPQPEELPPTEEPTQAEESPQTEEDQKET
jgi:hypothetical protein